MQKHRDEQLVLVREATEDRADADARAFGDHRERRVDPLLGEHLARGLDDAREVALGVRTQLGGGSTVIPRYRLLGRH